MNDLPSTYTLSSAPLPGLTMKSSKWPSVRYWDSQLGDRTFKVISGCCAVRFWLLAGVDCQQRTVSRQPDQGGVGRRIFPSVLFAVRMEVFFFPPLVSLTAAGTYGNYGPMILRVMPQIRAGWCVWSETVGSITRMFKLYMSQIGSCVLRKSTGSWPCHLELFLSCPISPFEALVSSQNEGLEKHQSPYIKQNSTKEKHRRPRHKLPSKANSHWIMGWFSALSVASCLTCEMYSWNWTAQVRRIMSRAGTFHSN